MRKNLFRSRLRMQKLFNLKEDSDRRNNRETRILKNKENISPLNIKLEFSESSESESEERSDFSTFSQRIHSTPLLKNLGNLTHDSDSDDVFSDLAERLSIKFSPRTENKENYRSVIESEAVKEINEFRTPMCPKKKTSQKAVDSESDESFLSFIEQLKTPMSVNRKTSQKAVDSESDESFLSFIEKLKTPMSVNSKVQHKVKESDSDDSFVNSLKKQAFRTPSSQKKSQNNSISLPKNAEIKECNSSALRNASNSTRVCKSENEKEFISLFQPERIASTFLQKRLTYTHKLYEFYNRKVFNSQLPQDMPLRYDGTLKTTAGLTCCTVEKGVFKCSIKLSSSLLNSFDNLRDTLLHEMCHAAVWVINKQQRVRHGPLWQIWASRCKMILPFIKCPTRCHNYEISYNIWYRCPKCDWKIGRCKQVRTYHGALCKRCKTPIIMTRN